MSPELFFFCLLDKEIQRQVEEQTIIFVQITYASHKEEQRISTVNRQHMADMFTSEYQAMANM